MAKRQPTSSRPLRVGVVLVLLLLVLLGVGAIWLVQNTRTPSAATRGRPSPTVAAQESTASQPGRPDRTYAYAGLPKGAMPVTVLTNLGYVVGYSEVRRDPLWVCYRLARVASEPSSPRPDHFTTDTRTKALVTPDAYTRSGYDRGHLAPNYGIATRYGDQAQLETFRMSNIVPQTPNLNRTVWKRLEQFEADQLAQQCEEVWVITGPVFDAAIERLASGVEVPDACYKIIADEDGGKLRVLAFIIPQDTPTQARIESYLTSVDEVERETGLDFLADLPDDVENQIEAQRPTTLWYSPN